MKFGAQIGAFLLFLLFGFSVIVSVDALEFNGYVRNSTVSALNATNVSVTYYNLTDWSIAGQASALSNATGFFNVSGIIEDSGYLYQIRHIYYSDSGIAEQIGPLLPQFGSSMLTQLNGGTYYLKTAGTINLTAVKTNNTGDEVTAEFNYMIKDKALGFIVGEDWQNYNTNVQVTVPAARNYSIMIYPNESMPVSYNLNNLSLYSNNLASIQINGSTLMRQVSGYATLSNGEASFDNFHVVAYLLEPGNMIVSQGMLPYNMSSFSVSGVDFVNSTTGFFNISLPGTAADSNMMLVAYSNSSGTYYASYNNLSLDYSSSEFSNFNVTLKPLSGNLRPFVANLANGGQVSIPASQTRFQIINESGAAILTDTHIEAELTYNNFTFTWMLESNTSDGSFYIPLWNDTAINKIILYNTQSAPIEEDYTAAEVLAPVINITLYTFNPEDIDGNNLNLSVYFYMSNTSCNVPNPAIGCLIGNPMDSSTFNPMQAVMSGAALSLRMIQTVSNITVHYSNVDLLASGPPDAMFDRNASDDTSGSVFENAWRFGSRGPDIYDEIIMGIPYTEASTISTGLDDSKDIKISIPVLYDNDWVATWNRSAGDNISTLPSDYVDFNSGIYAPLVNGTGVNCSKSDTSSVCYADINNNIIWLRIPHFSGVESEVNGTASSANGESCSAASECYGGHCVHNVCRSASTYCGDGYCDAGEFSSTCSADCYSSSGGSSSSVTIGKSHSFTRILSNDITTMTISDENIPAKKLEIILSESVNGAKFTFKSYPSRPSTVSEPKSNIYKYFDVTTWNVPNNKIKSAYLYFDVDNNWLNDNNVTSVVLMRYSGDSWNNLDTNLVSEGTVVSTYKSKTPGFSVFAIGEKIEDELEQGSEATPSEDLELSKPNKESEQKQEIQALSKPENRKNFAYFLIVIVAIGLIYFVFKEIYLNKNIKKINNKRNK